MLEEMAIHEACRSNTDVLAELDYRLFEDQDLRKISFYIPPVFFENQTVTFDLVRAKINADAKEQNKGQLLDRLKALEGEVFGYYDELMPELKDNYRQRELKRIFQTASKIGDDTCTFDDIPRLMQEAMAVYEYGLTENIITNGEKVKEELLSRKPEYLVQKRCAFGKQSERSTILRMIFGDYLANRLYVISGRPSMGKNIIADNIVWDFLSQGINGTYFSFDNNKDETVASIMAIASGVAYKHIEDAFLSEPEKNSLEKIIMSGLNIVDKKQNIKQIRRILEREKKNRNIRFFLIDYFTNIRLDSRMDKVQQFENIALEIKNICKELELSALILSQVNKDGETKWCSGLFEEAFFMLGIDGERETNKRKVSVEKYKKGKLQSFEITFVGACGHINIDSGSIPHEKNDNNYPDGWHEVFKDMR